MEIFNGHNKNLQQEMKPKYQPKQVPNYSCPRCDSTNTKFCYYNNYSLSQPRYFCKACRRYWTKGGILRNVPVGGGCRKNKRSSSSSLTKKSILQKPPSESMAAIPNFTLAFDPFLLENPNPNPNPSFLEILRGGGGVVEPTHESHGGDGFQSLCYGFGGGGNDQRGMLPYHGGSDSTAPVMAVRDDDVGRNHGGVGLGLEAERDYWNDSGSCVSSSSWHGLVNSSFL